MMVKLIGDCGAPDGWRHASKGDSYVNPAGIVWRMDCDDPKQWGWVKLGGMNTGLDLSPLSRMYGWPFEETPEQKPQEKTPDPVQDFISRRIAKRQTAEWEESTRAKAEAIRAQKAKDENSESLGNAMSKTLSLWEMAFADRLVPYRNEIQ